MNILHTEWWSIGIPPEWWADREEDSIVIGDRDEVGVIEFSTLHKDDGTFSREEVAGIARGNAEQLMSWAPVSAGDFTGVTSFFAQDDAHVREWYLAREAILLYVTYSCEQENAGMDAAAVDEILGTLQMGGSVE